MRNERALGPIILERLSASATRSQMPCLSPILPCAQRSRRHASMMIASLSARPSFRLLCFSFCLFLANKRRAQTNGRSSRQLCYISNIAPVSQTASNEAGIEPLFAMNVITFLSCTLTDGIQREWRAIQTGKRAPAVASVRSEAFPAQFRRAPASDRPGRREFRRSATQ